MKILVWGCGNMASATVVGLKRHKPNWQFVCWNPSPEKAQALANKVSGTVLKTGEMFTGDAVMLGFKPQKLAEAAPGLLAVMPKNAVVVSLLAAITIEQLSKTFGERGIVRLMPNLAVEHGDGVVLWEQHKADATVWREALSGLGLAPQVSEKLMDVYTVHSGSSPAFLYAWIDAASEFAVENGGDAELAKQLLIKTWQGALKNLEHEKLSMQEKIAAVASKGGITQAALDRFKEVAPRYIQEGFKAGLDRITKLRS